MGIFENCMVSKNNQIKTSKDNKINLKNKNIKENINNSFKIIKDNNQLPNIKKENVNEEKVKFIKIKDENKIKKNKDKIKKETEFIIKDLGLNNNKNYNKEKIINIEKNSDVKNIDNNSKDNHDIEVNLDINICNNYINSSRF